MKTRSQFETIPFFDVVISGMGLAGLMAAYKAVKANKRVLIFTKEAPGFTRVHSVFLGIANRQALWDMLPRNTTNESLSAADIHFRQLLNSTVPLPINLIEAYMMRRLVEMKSHNAAIAFDYHTQVNFINMQIGLAIHRHTDGREASVRFTYYVGADGTKRHALSVLQTDSELARQRFHITHTSDHNPLNTYVSMLINLTRKDNLPLNLPHLRGICAFDDQYFYAVDLRKNTANPTQVTCYTLFKLSNARHRKPVLVERFRKAMMQKLRADGYDNGELCAQVDEHHLDNRANRLRYSLFKVTPSTANIAAFSRCDHHFILLGDAYLAPHFRTASGARNALFQASFFGEALAGRTSLAMFNQHSQRLVDQTKHIERQLAQQPNVDRAQLAARTTNSLRLQHAELSRHNYDNPAPSCVLL